jgi:divalent metal cation (Fe/Co/Zn/Cd) transporter
MEGRPLELPLYRGTRPEGDRARLVRRAKLLAWLGLGWHGVEAAIALVAGLAAGSVALVGFGGDSIIEAGAAVILLWRFGGTRSHSQRAELRAQRLIGASFFLLAAYIGVEALRAMIAADHPQVSWVGIGLAAVTLVVMPILAAAKARVGDQLKSSATKSEGRQNQICAYLSAALLIGLGGNALFGLWWLDPVTALLIATVAVDEGREAWRGNACCEEQLSGRSCRRGVESPSAERDARTDEPSPESACPHNRLDARQ